MDLPEVQPIEHLLDLSSFWLARTLATIPSPGQLSWRYCNLIGFGGFFLLVAAWVCLGRSLSVS